MVLLRDNFVKNRLKSYLVSFAGIALLAGCGLPVDQADTKFRPFDPKERNVFYVVGAPNGLAGVATDVREMANVLGDATLGYNWVVNKNGNAAKADILASLTRYAAEVGENGTLGFFVSGHGSSSGQFMTANGMLGFAEVARAINTGRATPLRRLLTFNDSCFAGHWANGNGALDDYDGSERRWTTESAEPDEYVEISAEQENLAAEQMAHAMANDLHEVGVLQNGIREFVTFAASRKDQTSLDMGSARGGAFTYNLRQTFASLRKGNPNATVNDLIEQTKTATWNMTKHHNPTAAVFPKSLAGEFLFKDTPAPSPTPIPTPTPTAE